MVEKSREEKFMVEKSGVERFGVEAWGWKFRGWDAFQPSVVARISSVSFVFSVIGKHWARLYKAEKYKKATIAFLSSNIV